MLRSRGSDDPVSYGTEPAHASLFQPSRRHAASVEARKTPHYVLYSPPRAGLVRVARIERFGGPAGFGPIHGAEVSNAMAEFIGTPDAKTSLEYEAKADAKTEARARRVLNEVRVEQKNGYLRLAGPDHTRGRRCLTEFAIYCPSERAVTVRGYYAAIRIADMNGGVDVETTHARITLLNISGSVHASVQKGILDYSGHQGIVRLFAGWELNLNFPYPEFTGEMHATARGAVRVLLPPGFTAPLEASVATDADFVCRADIVDRIVRRHRDGRTILSFGEAPPVIRLESLEGPIVIDNSDSPPKPAAA